jgi:hypothetical protein
VAYSNRERDPTCGGTSERWAAPGSERTDLEPPDGYAYFTGARDSWYGNYDIMTLSDVPQKITVRYDPVYARDRTALHDVTPYWLDNAGCRPEGTITVPGGGEAGSIYTTSTSSPDATRAPLWPCGVTVTVRDHNEQRLSDAMGKVLMCIAEDRRPTATTTIRPCRHPRPLPSPCPD